MGDALGLSHDFLLRINFAPLERLDALLDGGEVLSVGNPLGVEAALLEQWHIGAHRVCDEAPHLEIGALGDILQHLEGLVVDLDSDGFAHVSIPSYGGGAAFTSPGSNQPSRPKESFPICDVWS